MNPLNFEEYVKTLQETMAGAIAEAEALAILAGNDREAAADVGIAIQAKRNALDNLARQTATDYVHAHQQELKANIRAAVVASVVAKLLDSGESVPAIAELLAVPEEEMGTRPL